MVLGISSLSALGPIGAAIEITIIMYPFCFTFYVVVKLVSVVILIFKMGEAVAPDKLLIIN